MVQYRLVNIFLSCIVKEIGNLFDISDIGPHYFMYKKFDYEWKKINSERNKRLWDLSTCRKVGNLLFLSGVGPRKSGQIDIPGVTLTKMEK